MRDRRCPLDGIGATAKRAAQDLEPARHLMGDALLQSGEFVLFVLDCLGRAVSNAMTDAAAAIVRTYRGA